MPDDLLGWSKSHQRILDPLKSHFGINPSKNEVALANAEGASSEPIFRHVHTATILARQLVTASSLLVGVRPELPQAS